MDEDQKFRVAKLWNEGMSFSEIAEEIGITRSAVAGQISRMRSAGYVFERTALPPPKKPLCAPAIKLSRCRRERNPIAQAILDGAEERARMRAAKIRMDHVQHKPIERLADKIATPGIDKHLVPLCLYMGTRSFGRIHRWWNFSIAAMEQGVEDFTDLVKLSHHPDYSHLCGTSSKINRLSAEGFFTRLRDNPGVTDNIPHMTEWAEHMMPVQYTFQRVPLETFEKNAAPWRLFKLRPRHRSGGNIKAAPASACYPFIAHDPKKEGFDLVSKVNKAVPRGLPEEIRADICQDIICAILAGEMKESDLQGSVKDFIAQGRKMFADKWAFVSLDAEIPGMDGKKYIDNLSGDINEGWELV